MGIFISIVLSLTVGFIVGMIKGGMLKEDHLKKVDQEIEIQKRKVEIKRDQIKKIKEKTERIKNEKMPDNIDDLIADLESIEVGL
jgi:uncharacterized protein YmfQ (DUF2313 family)